LKQLLSTTEIREAKIKGNSEIRIDSSYIVTPSAKDMARELGISIVFGCPNTKETLSCKTDTNDELTKNKQVCIQNEKELGEVEIELIFQIVLEIVKKLISSGALKQ
jgi:ethanolamine utilization cobalamin adenosyltransferase